MREGTPNRRIDLGTNGIRLFACRLTNHDYLWFSSSEIGKTSVTLPIIHNYALTYALAGYSHGIYLGSAPRYQEDLARMLLYTTPALAEEASHTRFTYNAINDRTIQTVHTLGGINSPDLGWHVVLDPIYDPEETEPTRHFRFYCFTFDSQAPRTCFRLGKKGCPVRISWEEISPAIAVFNQDIVRPTHAVNPLDLIGTPVAYEPINIPPHLLLQRLEVREAWIVSSGIHRVLLPSRIMAHFQDVHR